MQNKYKIYLDIDGETLTIPVPPKENPVKYPSTTKKYNILGIGDVIASQSPGLMVITVDSYFPGSSNDPLLFGRRWRRPKYFVEAIEDARNDGSVIDVVVCRCDATGKRVYDTNVSAKITNFQTTDKGGEPGDVYYKLELTEYRSFGASKIVLPLVPVQGAETPGEPVPASAEEAERPVTSLDLYVGVSVIANGTYYNDSYGGKPASTANNLSTTVSRIIDDPARPYPILLGGNRGWIKRDQLQVVK